MNQYKLVKKLGNGSFGVVFLAEVKNSNPKQFVALKRIKCDTLEQANESMKEIWPLRKLLHPNLIQCIDFFLDKSYATSPSLRRSFSSNSQFSPPSNPTANDFISPTSSEETPSPPTAPMSSVEEEEESIPLYVCFVLEYANGGDLSHFIKQFKTTKHSIPLDILFQFCDNLFQALICLHSHRLIHRDIKPQNVLLCKQADNSCVFKLADFGYLKELQQNNSFTTNSIVGTAQYNSVELMSKKPYNEKTDIWSLGVVLFEMLTLQIDQVLYMELITNEKATVEWIKEQITAQGHNVKIWYDQLLSKMLCIDASKRANATECLALIKVLRKRAYFELIPPKLWLHVLSFLDTPQLCHEINLVSKQFHYLSLANSIWKKLYFNFFKEDFSVGKYGPLLKWTEAEVRKWYNWKQLYRMRSFYEGKVVMDEYSGVSLGSPLKTQLSNGNDWQTVEYSEFDEHETKLLHIFRIEELERSNSKSLSIDQQVKILLEQAILYSKIGAINMATEKQAQAREMYRRSLHGANLVLEDVKTNIEVGKNKIKTFFTNLKTKVIEFIDPTTTHPTPKPSKSISKPTTTPSRPSNSSSSSTPTNRIQKSISITFPFNSSITIQGAQQNDLFAEAAWITTAADTPTRKSLDGASSSSKISTNSSSTSTTPIKAKQVGRTRQSTGFFGISFPVTSASTPPHVQHEDILSRSLEEESMVKQNKNLFKEGEE